MTQDKSHKIGTGTIALCVSALICAGSIALAVTWGHHKDAASGYPEASPSAGMDLISGLEQQAKSRPDDAATLAALGTAYFDAGRYGDAVQAYERAKVINPGKAALWSALAEARVMASERDPMPKQAAAEFEHALALDAKEPRARYFQAVKLDLVGKHQAAIDAWLALLADTPSGAPWEADLRRTIEQVGKINHIEVAAKLAMTNPAIPPRISGNSGSPALTGIPGPTPEQLQGAASIPPSQQNLMAEGMVARLEAKLQAQPANPDGWLMLMRSRMTLGQADKARQALADAVKANPDQSVRIRREAGILGVR